MSATLKSFTFETVEVKELNTPGTAATGALTVADVPVDGETITLDGGAGNSIVLEWDDDASTGNDTIALDISGEDENSTLRDYAAILNTAINANEANITAVLRGEGSSTPATIDLTNDAVGTDGNVSVAVGNDEVSVTATGMSGGVAATTTSTSDLDIVKYADGSYRFTDVSGRVRHVPSSNVDFVALVEKIKTLVG